MDDAVAAEDLAMAMAINGVDSFSARAWGSSKGVSASLNKVAAPVLAPRKNLRNTKPPTSDAPTITAEVKYRLTRHLGWVGSM